MSVADLRDTGRLLVLLDQAIGQGRVGVWEADRLRFVAAAEHATAAGTRNAPGLFAHLVRRGLWGYATASDESSGSARLRRHLRGGTSGTFPAPTAATPAAAARGSLSEDARLVGAVRSAARCAGHRGDAFPLLRRERPEWTRARWDQAVLECEPWRGPSPPSAGRPIGVVAPAGTARSRP